MLVLSVILSLWFTVVTAQQCADSTQNNLPCNTPQGMGVCMNGECVLANPCNGLRDGDPCGLGDGTMGVCSTSQAGDTSCVPRNPPNPCKDKQAGDACDFGGMSGQCQMIDNALMCAPVDPCQGKQDGDVCTINGVEGTCQMIGNALNCAPPATNPCDNKAENDECDLGDGTMGVCTITTGSTGLFCGPRDPPNPCKDKQAGDACNFDGMSGQCQLIDNALMCAPVDSCQGKQDGDVCTFNGVEGTCQMIDNALNCAPRDPTNPCDNKAENDECDLGDGTMGVCTTSLLGTGLFCGPRDPPNPCKDAQAGDACDLVDGTIGVCTDSQNGLYCGPRDPPSDPCKDAQAGDACDLGDGTMGACAESQTGGPLMCFPDVEDPCKDKQRDEVCTFNGMEGTCVEEPSINGGSLVCQITTNPCAGADIQTPCGPAGDTMVCQQNFYMMDELACGPVNVCTGLELDVECTLPLGGTGVCSVNMTSGFLVCGAANADPCKDALAGDACVVAGTMGVCTDSPNGLFCGPRDPPNPCKDALAGDDCDLVDGTIGVCTDSPNGLYCGPRDPPSDPCKDARAGDPCDLGDGTFGSCHYAPGSMTGLVCVPMSNPCEGKRPMDLCMDGDGQCVESADGLICLPYPACRNEDDCNIPLNELALELGVNPAYLSACNAIRCLKENMETEWGQCQILQDGYASGDACQAQAQGAIKNGECVDLNDDPNGEQMLVCNATIQVSYQYNATGFSECSGDCKPAYKTQEFECVKWTYFSTSEFQVESMPMAACKETLGSAPIPETIPCEDLPNCGCSSSECPVSMDSCQAYQCNADTSTCDLGNREAADVGSDCYFVDRNNNTKTGSCQIDNGMLFCQQPAPVCPEDGKDGPECPWNFDLCTKRTCTDSTMDSTLYGLQCDYDYVCETTYQITASDWSRCVDTCGPEKRYKTLTCYELTSADGQVIFEQQVPCEGVPGVPSESDLVESCGHPECQCQSDTDCDVSRDSCKAFTCPSNTCVLGNAAGAAVDTPCTLMDPAVGPRDGTCQQSSEGDLYCREDVNVPECPDFSDRFTSVPGCRAPTRCETRVCTPDQSDIGGPLCSYADECTVSYRQDATDWGDCTATCGNGTQYRGVKCFKLITYPCREGTYPCEPYTEEERVPCEDIPDPAPTSRPCKDLPACEYSECNTDAACGPCEVCMIAPDSNSGVCEYTCKGCQSCERDTTASGSDEMDRHVCTPNIGEFYTPPFSEDPCVRCSCQDNGEEVCVNKCEYRVFSEEGDWSECSATCGDGRQFRSVVCFEEVTFPDGTTRREEIECFQLDPVPEKSRTCQDPVLEPCPEVQCQTDDQCGGCEVCNSDGKCEFTCKSCQYCAEAEEGSSRQCMDACESRDDCTTSSCREVFTNTGSMYECVVENQKERGQLCGDPTYGTFQCLCATGEDICNSLSCVNTDPRGCDMGPEFAPGYIFEADPSTDPTYAHQEGVQYICDAGLYRMDPDLPAVGSVTCVDGEWTEPRGCIEIGCDGLDKGESCVDGICNKPADGTDMDATQCDTTCPFLSERANNPCFVEACYSVNNVWQFDQENPECVKAVDAYCGENPNAPGCASDAGLCTVRCGGPCPACPEPGPDPEDCFQVYVNFALQEGSCDFKSDYSSSDAGASMQIWGGYNAVVQGNDLSAVNEFGIGAMVRSCVGEYFGNFEDYYYFFSEGETWSVSDNVVCTSAYKSGGAKANICGNDRYTAAQALDGLYALATSKECLATLPTADDISVALVNGGEEASAKCADFTDSIVCDGGVTAFLPDNTCLTSTCATVECCDQQGTSAAASVSVGALFPTMLSVLVLLLVSRWD